MPQHGPMLTPDRSRAIALLAMLAVAIPACGLGVATLQASIPPTPGATAQATPQAIEPINSVPSATQTLEPRLDAAQLVARIGETELTPHLASLQRIADAHGGHRLTGSDGYETASSYVVDILEAAGYRVERRPFSLDGVAGTNLLVERTGTSDEVVMLGAHLDTVVESPGMNDNASGVAAALAIAEALAELPPPHRTIRLAVWDAEEGGPFGSRAYVASLSPEELARIHAYLNLDMIGSPNALRLVYAEAGAADGSEAITDRVAAALADAGLAWEPIDLEGDSDHGPFSAAGIPTGGLFSGGIEPVTDAQAARFGATANVPADACSHRPCDTLENVNPEVAAELARVAATVLVGLAEAAG